MQAYSVHVEVYRPPAEVELFGPSRLLRRTPPTSHMDVFVMLHRTRSRQMFFVVQTWRREKETDKATYVLKMIFMTVYFLLTRPALAMISKNTIMNKTLFKKI